MIPKIIHYCWLSNNQIPEVLQNYMKTWKEKLQDYTFIQWNFERFDKESSLWVKQAFEAKKYAFAADYIRLYAIYHHGGIYLDMDVEILKPFDTLLNQSYFLGYETNGGIEAAIFGAEPHVNWLKKCLDYYNDREFIKKDGTYDTTTLPNIWKKVLRTDLKNMNLLPAEYLSPKSFENGKILITPKTYSVHHFSGSWIPWHKKIRKKIARYIGEKPTQFIIQIKHIIFK